MSQPPMITERNTISQLSTTTSEAQGCLPTILHPPTGSEAQPPKHCNAPASPPEHPPRVTDTRQSPQQLLDPSVPILQQLFRDIPGVFPAGEFAESRWLEVLRATGLQRTLSAHLLLVR